MAEKGQAHLFTLDLHGPIWSRFFTVAPLVLIGTKEPGGSYNLAPKHQVTSLGLDHFFCFVCTPRHSTYHNIQREGEFSVSYPRPTQVVLSSLAAAPRSDDGSKPSLDSLPTYPARKIDGILFAEAYLHFECRRYKIFDEFGDNSLIVGEILAAHVHERYLRSQDRDDHEMIHKSPLLAYLSPGRYARIQQSFSFPYPEDFSP